MSTKTLAERALEQGNGILRFAPAWVPRSFLVLGRRIKLHPDDYFAYGAERGGISERWLASTTPVDNGALTTPNQGLSVIVFEDGAKTEKLFLRDAVSELKGALIGGRLWDEYQSWPMYSKFFDNKAAIPFHIHHRDEHASLVNQMGKSEAYYYPTQLNNYSGDFPYTFYGLIPGTSKEQVLECLKNFSKGDNKITNLSKAYRLEPGTGWNLPAGLLHAPGSLCTYEPQKASDVYAMYQSLVDDKIVSEELLWKDTPENMKGDFEHLLAVIDWELNLDPDFKKKHFMPPRPVAGLNEMESSGYREFWICYKSKDFSAKELTVMPGREAIIYDNAAYGMIMLQGHGKIGVWNLETPAMIRFGQLTYDEFFVSEKAAEEGVLIKNMSQTDPIVMLKHFGPGNPGLTRSQLFAQE